MCKLALCMSNPPKSSQQQPPKNQTEQKAGPQKTIFFILFYFIKVKKSEILRILLKLKDFWPQNSMQRNDSKLSKEEILEMIENSRPRLARNN